MNALAIVIVCMTFLGMLLATLWADDRESQRRHEQRLAELRFDGDDDPHQLPEQTE